MAACDATAGEVATPPPARLVRSPRRPSTSEGPRREPQHKRRQPEPPLEGLALDEGLALSPLKTARTPLPCPLAVSRRHLAQVELLLAETHARARLRSSSPSKARLLEVKTALLQARLLEAKIGCTKRELHKLRISPATSLAASPAPCLAAGRASSPAPSPTSSPTSTPASCQLVSLVQYADDVICTFAIPAPTPDPSDAESHQPPSVVPGEVEGVDWDPDPSEA
ncbi:unnamed protein product [Prorocentrum cordatum]|uniref:Uncharacterized protein n=1 Tax=Prorocentrum cordatum TaxID=2364126 RepID=A0ABN9XMZ2_9DINO|nr:unnamed protein product [Polarella glacialis]